MALTQISTKGIKDGTITGSDLATNVDLVDNQYLRIGTGNDLQIYHNGNVSVIKDVGTGPLGIRGSSIHLQNPDGSKEYAGFTEDGAASLYYANSKKFETTSAGATVTGDLLVSAGVKATTNYAGDDNVKLKLGTSDDLQIYHNGSNTFIDNYTGVTFIRGGTHKFRKLSDNEDMLILNPNAAVELYYDGNKKFETTSAGATLTGDLTITDDLYLQDNLLMGDGDKIAMGDGEDLQIYHDGSHSRIVNGTNGGTLRLQTAGSEEGIVIRQNAAVELYYDNVKTFSTDGNGIFAYGPEGGTANVYIYADEGDDDADKWSLTSGTDGTFTINNRASGGFEKNIECNGNGNVELYYDNSKKLETTSGGGILTGDWSVTNDFFWFDNGEAVFGSGGDLKIFHDGSHSVIDNLTGGLFIKGGTSDGIQIQNRSGNESMAKFIPDGAVELYWNNGLRASTDNQGLLLPTGKGVCFGDVGCKVSGVPGGGGSAGISFMVNSGGSWKIDGNGVFLNNNRNEAPSSLKGAIHFKPSASGGSTGILFNSNVNANSDCGYIWWYDDNNNYRINDSAENGALVIGIQNDGNATSEDAVAIESSGNIFLNPGNDGGLANAGGNTGPDFSEGKVYIGRGSTKYEVFHGGSHSLPDADNTYDLGSSSKRFRFVYTTDLQLSNENTGGNEVDGTWGNYTIQEGADDLFLINRRSGKRYKFNLTEVS